MPPFEQDANLNAGRNAGLSPEKSNTNVSYVGISDFYTDYSPGTFNQTNGTLDLALNGKGYLTVSTEEGDRYTRNGNLRLNTKNQLVTQKGQTIQDTQGNPIVIDVPGADISIDQEGNISAGNGVNNLAIGKLKIIDFKNPKSLQKLGDGLFEQTNPNAELKQIKETTISQGYLENSNVSTVEEMTEMVGTLRIFESYQKIIQSIDSMNDQSVNTIGRVG